MRRRQSHFLVTRVTFARLTFDTVWAFHALVYSELRYNYSVPTLTIVLAGIGAEAVISRVQRRA